MVEMIRILRRAMYILPLFLLVPSKYRWMGVLLSIFIAVMDRRRALNRPRPPFRSKHEQAAWVSHPISAAMGWLVAAKYVDLDAVPLFSPGTIYGTSWGWLLREAHPVGFWQRIVSIVSATTIIVSFCAPFILFVLLNETSRMALMVLVQGLFIMVEALMIRSLRVPYRIQRCRGEDSLVKRFLSYVPQVSSPAFMRLSWKGTAELYLDARAVSQLSEDIVFTLESHELGHLHLGHPRVLYSLARIRDLVVLVALGWLFFDPRLSTYSGPEAAVFFLGLIAMISAPFVWRILRTSAWERAADLWVSKQRGQRAIEIAKAAVRQLYGRTV